VSWLLAAGSYLVVLVATVLVATRGRPRSLLGRSTGRDGGSQTAPDALAKVVTVLYPLLLAVVAAVAWAVLWFGLYAVD
jgi:hypothetical protein